MEHTCSWCGGICASSHTAIIAHERVCEDCRGKLREQFSNLFGVNSTDGCDTFGVSVKWDVVQLLVLKALRDARKRRTVFYIDDSDVAKLR